MFSSESYDQIFATEPEYTGHYSRSSYLPIWKLVAAKIDKDSYILDLGCGPGQFAAYLYDQGFTNYTGIDFSHVAIERAQSINPAFTFICADLSQLRFSRHRPDIIFAIETFEHIADDRALIRRLPPARLIFTVPNYPAPNHYRTYRDESFIRDYYRDVLTIESIERYHCKRSDYIFIVDSVTHRKG